MLSHATLNQLQELRLTGMAKAFEEQLRLPSVEDLSFEQRLGLLVEREVTERSNRRLQTRLRKAKLREAAALEDLDWTFRRGLDKSQVLHLASCQWIAEHLNVLVSGPTGIGKTFLACALAHKACREGYSSLYLRVPRLLRDLQVARLDGSYDRLLTSYARMDLLVLEDWGLVPLSDEHRRDLLEILEDRYNRRSTLVTSQFPVETWHEGIGDPTLADSILDRLVHGAYQLAMKGDSMRRQRAQGPVSPVGGGGEPK